MLPDSFSPTDHVLARLTSEKLEIFIDELIGQPYGLTYEISDKKLHVLSPRTLEELVSASYSVKIGT